VFVVDGEVLACMERRAKDGGFKANFSQGGAVEEFDLNEEAKQIAIDTAKAMDIRIAGIDLLFTDDGFTICEANTFPGFKGLEQACDINIPQTIFKSMLNRLEEKNAELASVSKQAV
jgi:RimK family alpha-L-glutamate ligase